MDLELKARGRLLAVKFEEDWGAFRRFQAEHPLTAGWFMFCVGAALSAILVWIV